MCGNLKQVKQGGWRQSSPVLAALSSSANVQSSVGLVGDDGHDDSDSSCSEECE